jgi:putative glutamine amidotransferase
MNRSLNQPKTGRQPTSPPLIGITTYSALARWGVWNLPATLTPDAYVRAVADAGGTPVLLPALPEDDASDLVGAMIEPLQGLILCGGPDIAPGRYGALPSADTGAADELRDAFEHRLLDAASARAVPVLGICRGMQMLNVWSGGTLDQHLSTADGHRGGPGEFAEHDVAVEPGGRLAAAIGRETSVHSYHHQGIDRLGVGLCVAARDADGQIEAIEDPDRHFWLGVLWHPEMSADRSLFRALIEASGR